MSRYEPWEDHELAILYEYANVRMTVDVTLQLCHLLQERTVTAIQNRMYKLREEASIILGGSHRPTMVLQSELRASARLADAIEREINRLPQQLSTGAEPLRMKRQLTNDSDLGEG